MEKRKIRWIVKFIRGDHSEYGELTQYIFAKDQDAVINNIKSGYGESAKIISIK